MWVCKITQRAALAIIRISRTHCGEPAWTSARGQAQFLHITHMDPHSQDSNDHDHLTGKIHTSFGQPTCCSLLVMQSFARILKWPSAGWGFQTLKIHEDMHEPPNGAVSVRLRWVETPDTSTVQRFFGTVESYPAWCCNIVLHRFSIYGLRTQCNYRNAHFSQVKDLKPTIGIHWWIPVCTTSTKCSWTLYWIILFRPFRPMSTCFTTLDPARDETLWRPEPFQTCWIQPGQPLSGLGRAHCFRIRCL